VNADRTILRVNFHCTTDRPDTADRLPETGGHSIVEKMSWGGRSQTGAWVSLALAAIVAGYAVLFAANPAQSHAQPRTHQFITVVMAGALGVISWLWMLRTRSVSRSGRRLESLALLLPLYVLFQLLPLPVGLLRILSPARARLLDSISPVLPQPSWAPLSVAPGETVYLCLILSACAVIFLVVWGIAWATALPLVILAGAEALLGFLQLSQNPTDSFTHLGTYENRDHFAGFLEWVLPLAFVLPLSILAQPGKRTRHESLPLTNVLLACAGFALAGLILVGILMALSRMAFMSAIVTLVFVSVASFSRGRSWRQIAIISAIVVALAGMAILVLPSDLLVGRLAGTDPHERLVVWRDTTRLIAAYPIFGCGLGAYASAFYLYKASNPDMLQDYAHNDYLQYISELGVLGTALAIWPLAILLGRLYRAWKNPSQAASSWLSIACAGSLLAVALHSVVDFNLYIPANMLVFSWILGLAASSESVSRAARSPAR
jgi:O-antigen ligase